MPSIHNARPPQPLALLLLLLCQRRCTRKLWTGLIEPQLPGSLAGEQAASGCGGQRSRPCQQLFRLTPRSSQRCGRCRRRLTPSRHPAAAHRPLDCLPVHTQPLHHQRTWRPYRVWKSSRRRSRSSVRTGQRPTRWCAGWGGACVAVGPPAARRMGSGWRRGEGCPCPRMLRIAALHTSNHS